MALRASFQPGLKSLPAIAVCIVIAILYWRSHAAQHQIAPHTAATAPVLPEVSTNHPAVPTITPNRPSADDDAEARRLLTEYALHRDPTKLLEAQILYPTNLAVIRISAMEATSPDSEHLLLLEVMEPDNALPNLLRAGLYAKTDPAAFLDELQRAIDKKEIFADGRQRHADALNAALEEGTDLAVRYMENLDPGYSNKFNAIYQALTNQPHLFESRQANYHMVAAFTDLWKTDQGLEFWNRSMGDLLKIDALYKIDENHSTSVAPLMPREEEKILELEADTQLNAFHKFHRMVMGKKAKPEVRRMYFKTMAEKGERAAMDWLLTR